MTETIKVKATLVACNRLGEELCPEVNVYEQDYWMFDGGSDIEAIVTLIEEELESPVMSLHQPKYEGTDYYKLRIYKGVGDEPKTAIHIETLDGGL